MREDMNRTVLKAFVILAGLITMIGPLAEAECLKQGESLSFSGSLLGENTPLQSGGKEIPVTFSLCRDVTVVIEVTGGFPQGGAASCNYIPMRDSSGAQHADLFNPQIRLYSFDGQLVEEVTSDCGRALSDETFLKKQIQLKKGRYDVEVVGQDVGHGWDAPYRVPAVVEVHAVW